MPEIFPIPHGGFAHPVFPFIFKLFLKPVDLLLEHVDPLGELNGRQLLLLLVTGPQGRTPAATAHAHKTEVNIFS